MDANEKARSLRIEAMYQRDRFGRDMLATEMEEAADLIEQQAFELAAPVVTGETSDGSHTFNELYHHRAVLFSAICNAHPGTAWKSLKHHDGTMYGGMFIVGMETPTGQATYHYYVAPYWEYFHVLELVQAPEYDGHTSEQAIERLLQFGFSAAAAAKAELAALQEVRKLAHKVSEAVLNRVSHNTGRMSVSQDLYFDVKRLYRLSRRDLPAAPEKEGGPA